MRERGREGGKEYVPNHVHVGVDRGLEEPVDVFVVRLVGRGGREGGRVRKR